MSTILLVEDDEMLADLVAHRLRRVGYDVITAVHGKEAIQKSQDDLPDLIIMDIRMPIMDGLEATKQIKSLDKTKHIPIIALTAQASRMDKQLAQQAGCERYVAKPIQFQLLFTEIKTLLTTNRSNG